jgi:hypothetical protein
VESRINQQKVENEASKKTKLALFFLQAAFSFVDFQNGLFSGTSEIILVELHFKVKGSKLKAQSEL